MKHYKIKNNFGITPDFEIDSLDLINSLNKKEKKLLFHEKEEKIEKENKKVISSISKKNKSDIGNIKIHRMKTILLGNIAVGKSSLIDRFVLNKFGDDYACTLGVEYKIKSIYIDNNTIVDLQLWDTCGQEKYRTITRQYYQNSNGVILMFDLTDKSTFNDIITWINDIRDYGPEECICILVGNKADKEEERKVSFEEAEKLAHKYKFDYFEISAKTNFGIKFVFDILARSMLEITDDKTIHPFDKGATTLMEDSSILREDKSSCCN